MAGETRRFVIERRTGGGDPLTGQRRFSAAPMAATGIEKTLGQSAKQQDRLTQIANKVYLEARALAPALRLIPGIGPVMSGATIAAGRGFAVAVGELKTSNLKSLGEIRDILGGTQALFHNFGQFFKTPPTSWSKRLFQPLASNFQQIGHGLGQVAGTILKILPIAAVMGAGVMAVLSISKLFRSWMGSIFGLLSMFLDILILPFMPLFKWVIQFLMGTVLPWVQAVASWLGKIDFNALFVWLGEKVRGIIDWWRGSGIPEALSGLWDTLGAVDWKAVAGTAGVVVSGLIGGLSKVIGFFDNPLEALGLTVAGGLLGFAIGSFLGQPVLGTLFGLLGGAIVAKIKEVFFPTPPPPEMRAAEEGGAPLRGGFAEWFDRLAHWLTYGGRFQGGTSFVPRTGPAMLHMGEAVIPANLRPLLGATFNNYFILGSSFGAGGVEKQINSDFEAILRKVLL